MVVGEWRAGTRRIVHYSTFLSGLRGACAFTSTRMIALDLHDNRRHDLKGSVFISGLSVRPSIRPSIRPSVHPSMFGRAVCRLISQSVGLSTVLLEATKASTSAMFGKLPKPCRIERKTRDSSCSTIDIR